MITFIDPDDFDLDNEDTLLPEIEDDYFTVEMSDREALACRERREEPDGYGYTLYA
jgi:hypothetical protein